jgi:hypothetical protein
MLDAQKAGALLILECPPSVTGTGEASLLWHLHLFFPQLYFAILIQNVKKYDVIFKTSVML